MEQPDEGDESNRGKLVALAVVVALVLGGLWLEQRLSASAKIQDCVMAGRSNCAPISTSGG